MGLSLTNNFLHKYALKAILPVSLRGRYIIRGESTEDKIVCISFDCDVDDDIERIPCLLDLLQEEHTPTSFAIVGNLASKYPVVIKEVLDKGHEIVNHCLSHPENFGSIGRDRMKTEIRSFQSLLTNEFCYRPEGFRAPHLMRKYNRDLFRILKEERLYDSSYVGRGLARIDDTVEVALTSCPEHPQLCFDYWHHFQLPLVNSTVNKFFDLWRFLLDNETLVNIYLDPHLTQDAFLKELTKEAISDRFKLLRLRDVAERLKVSTPECRSSLDEQEN